jgi:hypothetical protein
VNDERRRRMIKTIPEKQICSICDNLIGDECDGKEYICTTCGTITCIGQQKYDYATYIHTKPVPDYHLYVRGIGQYWNCGPIVPRNGTANVKQMLCDDPEYFDKLKANKESYDMGKRPKRKLIKMSEEDLGNVRSVVENATGIKIEDL